MTETQKLEVRASKLREELNTLLFQEDALTEEQNETLTEKRRELTDIERRWRTAIELSPDPKEVEKRSQGDTLSSEAIEFAKLEDSVSFGSFVLGHPTGESVEYRREIGLQDASIPLVALLDGPERLQIRADAYSEAPSSGTDVTAQPIIDRVTAQLAARRLGVQFPLVPRGQAAWARVSAGVTAASAAKGAAVDASAWTLTPTTASPKRLQVRISFRREDSAMVAGFEEALRREARTALGEAIDKMCVDSFGTGADLIEGLVPGLAAGTDYISTVSVGGALSAMSSVIDGRYASDLRLLRLCLGVASYRELLTTLTRVGLPQLAADLSAMIPDAAASIFTSGFIPEPENNLQSTLTWCGRADHVGAASPIWESGLSSVLDQYTGASKGEIYSDLILLTNFKIVDENAYSHRKITTS